MNIIGGGFLLIQTICALSLIGLCIENILGKQSSKP
jgi:hypothetical protein